MATETENPQSTHSVSTGVFWLPLSEGFLPFGVEDRELPDDDPFLPDDNLLLSVAGESSDNEFLLLVREDC